ncbi:hypothetical protein K435DRAFT_341841 [Dendrothele bispora CBS 962.96]|uniref:Fungal-type protein kinase domain-containing protein n=1 Tax=Dendrothele bispora (strain CBS 962.96) TaxID=1314807 RepID=A0A4S8LFK3_DENBC|nr:hypothetical protein K435DRAFT_341841 [Dendrothele bispora CBS 962.96]
MSTPLRKAMEIGLPYLQSPLDDMHSFFWTALWTVMCNKVKTSEEEWEALIMGNTDERDRAVDGILYRGTFAEDYSLLLRDMSPLLKDWQQDLLKPLNQDWAIAWKSVKDREVEEKLLVFHYFALRGILEFAKLIKKHEPRLTSTIHPTDSGTSDPQTTFGFCPIPVFADPAVTLDPSIIYSQTAFGTPVDISSIGQTDAPDYRAMCTHPSVGSTKFLEDCDSAWDLCECLLHASLGWLSCYMRGYMHRDVNTLSILKIDQGPKKRAPFSTRSVHSLLSISSEAHTTTGETSAKSCADESASSSDGLGFLDNCFAHLKVEEDTYWDDLLKALDDQATRTQVSGKQAASDKYIRQQDVAAMAKELEEIIRDLGITTECKAIISNFEIVAKIDASYFDPEMHDEEVSGVPAFMSTPLRKAMEIGLPYLQSPLDDMHSFFWTALWCALGNEEMSEKEDEWETRLEGSIDERDRTMHEILHQETFEEEHCSLLRGMSPLLRDWERNLLTLNGDWEVAWKSVKDRKVEEKLLVFHCFAFRGILEVVKLVAKHKPRLTSTANTN